MTDFEQRMADFKKSIAEAFAEPGERPHLSGGLLTDRDSKGEGKVDGAKIGIELDLPRPAS